MLWGGGLSRSKLLAAVAVLAIAFAVFAAVPAVAEDSDAANSSEVSVKNYDELKSALADTNVKTITLTADITGVDAALVINGKTINGGGHSITAVESKVFTGEWVSDAEGTIYLLNITGTATISNLTVDSAKLACGINVTTTDTSTEVKFDKVTSKDYVAAGFVIGGAKATLTDCVADSEVTGSWGGVNADKGAAVTIDSLKNIVYAYTEGTNGATITVTDSTGTIKVSAGTNVAYGTSTESTRIATNVAGLITVDFTVYEDAVFTVPADKQITLGSGKAITLMDGATFNGNVVYTTAAKTGTASGAYVSLTSSADNSKISYGSINISGSYSAGEIKNQIGDNTEVMFENLTITSGKLEIGEDVKVSIKQGSTVKIKEGAALSIASASDLSKGTIENDGTLFVNNKDIVLPSITGTGSVDTSGIASDGTISGDWKTSTKYGAYQTITLTGDTTLVEGTLIIIEGKMIIPEGVTLTIEDGARLVLYNGTAELENDGTIIVESKMAKVTTDKIDSDYFGIKALTDKSGGFIILAGASAVNDGSIILDYTAVEGDKKTELTSMNLDGANFENNGTITVGEDSYFANYKGVFKNTACLLYTSDAADE